MRNQVIERRRKKLPKNSATISALPLILNELLEFVCCVVIACYDGEISRKDSLFFKK
jgi:hypothetical protein